MVQVVQQGFRVGDGAVFRETIRRAVHAGQLVVRLEDGRAFDDKGCVVGEIGNRKRMAISFSTVAPHRDVLVALPTAELAKQWLATDEPQPDDEGGPDDGPPNPPPPPPDDDSIATTWEDAIEKAASREALTITLRAKVPSALTAFTSMTVPLSPTNQKLTIEMSGTVKDGGHINIALRNLKPSHPLKPAAMAASLYNALAEQNRTMDFRQVLGFGDGRTGLAERLAEAQEEVKFKQ